MGIEYLSPQNPLGSDAQADWQDQSGAGLQDFNVDDFVNMGDDAELFGSPSAENAHFNFDFGSTEPSSNDEASLAQPSTQAKEAVEGNPYLVAAPFSLTLPQDDADDTISDSELADLEAEFAAIDDDQPQPPNDDTMVGAGAVSSSMPPQHYAAQPQQGVQPPTMASTPRQQMYMPVPRRPLAPGNVVSTLHGYPPIAPRQPYLAQPRPVMQPPNMVNMPPTYSTNAYPVPVPPTYPPYQQPPPAAMRPVFPAPPQPLPPQLANGYLQPAPSLYQPYGYSQLKRPAEEADLPPSKKIRHRRDGNRRESNDPSRWYQPLPRKPTDWSPPPKPPSGRPNSPPPNPYREEPLFKYNANGEWLATARYSRPELEAFLLGTKPDGSAPSRRGKPTVWIQLAPSYDAHRYGPDAAACRWDKCPVRRNTISKGQFRVALDERPETSGVATDPFHCAGYMHLYCFEEAVCDSLYGLFFDGRFSVRPDRRCFRFEERNPMALSGTLVGVLDAWIRSEGRALREAGRRGKGGRGTPRERRLWYVLTQAHTASPGYLEGLERRNDVHVGKYMGDLRLYQQMRDEKLRREARVVEIEDDEDDEGVHRPPATESAAVRLSPRPEEAGDRQVVTERQTRRPSLSRYAPPVRRKRSSLAGEDGQAVSQAMRPSLALYKPPPSRKRSRAEDEDEGPACQQAPCSKRSKADLAEIEATVRTGLLRRKQQEICRVSRILTSMVPAVDGMPHYKRLEVERLVSREAERVRNGVVPRWGSFPTGLGCGT